MLYLRKRAICRILMRGYLLHLMMAVRNVVGGVAGSKSFILEWGNFRYEYTKTQSAIKARIRSASRVNMLSS